MSYREDPQRQESSTILSTRLSHRFAHVGIRTASLVRPKCLIRRGKGSGLQCAPDLLSSWERFAIALVSQPRGLPEAAEKRRHATVAQVLHLFMGVQF